MEEYPSELIALREEIDLWRNKHKKRYDIFSDDLWQRITDQLKHHKASLVATALTLNKSKLHHHRKRLKNSEALLKPKPKPSETKTIAVTQVSVKSVASESPVAIVSSAKGLRIEILPSISEHLARVLLKEISND